MKNPVLIFLLIFILSVICHHAACQNPTFSFKYATGFDEVPTHAVETADGGYIISAKQGTMEPYSSHVLFIRLNQWGDTIKTAATYDSTGNCFIYQIIPCDDGNYFAIGTWQYSPDEMNIWLMKMNENLEVLWEKKFSTNCYELDIALGLVDHSSNLILYGNGRFGSLSDNALVVIRCNQTGDSINEVRLTQTSHYAMVYEMAEKPDSSGFYLLIGGRFQVNTNSWGQILKLDTTLNLVDIDSIPGQLFHYHNILILGNKLFITGSRPYLAAYPFTVKLGFLQLDTAYQIQREHYSGPDDTVSYPGYIHNLSMIDTSYFYYGGTLNQDNNAIFSPKKTWYMLGKYDAGLNLIWQKFYGGNSNYGLWSLNVTIDGGCLLAGSAYDYVTQDNERDICILKVDSGGIITGDSGDSQKLIHDAVVYPNPGSDQLTVRSGPQVSGAVMQVTEISGHQVYQTTLSDNLTVIEAESWLSGTYIWQIIYQDQVIESGKWIKY